MFVRRLKLRPPPLLPLWIERADVEQRLRPEIRVFSIVGGPGYGKTVLAARLFARWRGPKLWYSLDESDADLPAFATHLDALVRSLDGIRPFEGDVAVLGSPKDVGSLYAEALADAMPAPLIVFDDVHVLEGSRALAALEELADRATRIGATFVLCGRSMPVALHPYAAAAVLAKADAGDLAFAPTEARAFLERVAGLHVDAAAIDDLARRAEGWPAGLALIASTAAVGGHTTAPGSTAARDDRTRRLLFDYLASEVLGTLRAEERAFLVETSILDILEVDVCDALRESDDSDAILGSLAARGLFVARRSDDAYVAHQMFRSFLRHELGLTLGAETIAQLHSRAADVFAVREDSARSIVHRLDAGEIERAARELESSVLTMLGAGLVGTLGDLLVRLPNERVVQSSELLFARGRVQRERGEWDAALGTLQRAIARARQTEAYDVMSEAIRALAPILASRGASAELRATIEAALALDAKLSDANRTTLRMILGALELETGEVDAALATFREIMPTVVGRGDLASQGALLHNLAVAQQRRGDLYAALSTFERALNLKRSAGQRVSAVLTLADLVFTRSLLGDLDEAERLAGEFLREATDLGSSAHVAHALGHRGFLALRRGDVTEAARAFAAAERACDPGDVRVLPDVQFGLAQCALATDDPKRADELCAAAITVFRAAGKRQQLAPILLTRAAARARQGEMTEAATLAREALAAASDGTDTVLCAATSLEAAALLVGLAASIPEPACDVDAADATRAALALIHQRDYRFLMRTKAESLESLYPHFGRWGLGGALPAERRPAPAPRLEVELLGGVRVTIDGQRIPPEAWKRRRAREIFAYLVGQGGRPVPRARLIDIYWPETDADAAHDSLRVTISAIRKAVGDVVRYETNGYRFAAPPGTVVDIVTFDDHIEQARAAAVRGDVEAVRRHYRGAADAYGGEFLEGIDEGGWQWHERERLRAACLEALRWIASDAVDEAAGRLALERFLAIAPFDLEAVRMRLDLLVRERRLSEARRDYAEWQARYRATVGTDPPDVWEPVSVAV